MKFGDVLYEANDRIARIILNRADPFNAIGECTPDDIAKAFEHASNDDSSRAQGPWGTRATDVVGQLNSPPSRP